MLHDICNMHAVTDDVPLSQWTSLDVSLDILRLPGHPWTSQKTRERRRLDLHITVQA